MARGKRDDQDRPSPSSVKPSERMGEDIGKHEAQLLTAIRELSVAKLKLSQVRSQPRPDQNDTWSAAQAFRQAESAVKAATDGLVAMHEQMMLQLAKEATEEAATK
jgi:hypothetical protein